MRPGSRLSELPLGHWLVTALTLTLVVAAVLAGVGLFRELTGASTTVVAQQPAQALAGSQPPPEELDDAEAVDGSADPIETSTDRGGSQVPGPPEAPGPDVVEERPGGVAITTQPPRGAARASPVPTLAAAPDRGPDHALPPAASISALPEALVAPESAVVAGPPLASPVIASVGPAPGARGAPRATADLPIVMYHHVGPLPPNPDVFRRDLTVSPNLFERTLQQLVERQIETVTMTDLFEHFAGGNALPKRSVVLTFDDGYDDNYQHAFRLLRQYGMVGTFFITTDFVERPGYLTWPQIAEMAAAGMEIAAHSVNHVDFTAISANELRRQLVAPKAVLEERLGQPVRFMAYPAGKYNASVMAATRAAGYEAAVTVLHGTRHSPAGAFELRRVRARGADTVAQIIARLTPPSWRQ